MNSTCLRHGISSISVNSDSLLTLSQQKISNILINQNKFKNNAICNLSLYSIIKIQTSNHKTQQIKVSKIYLDIFKN